MSVSFTLKQLCKGMVIQAVQCWATIFFLHRSKIQCFIYVQRILYTYYSACSGVRRFFVDSFCFILIRPSTREPTWAISSFYAIASRKAYKQNIKCEVIRYAFDICMCSVFTYCGVCLMWYIIHFGSERWTSFVFFCAIKFE